MGLQMLYMLAARKIVIYKSSESDWIEGHAMGARCLQCCLLQLQGQSVMEGTTTLNLQRHSSPMCQASRWSSPADLRKPKVPSPTDTLALRKLCVRVAWAI